ncbi:PREDICTED: tudor domain-containing protein 3-like isoform X2 [Priapulus caudatus]|uniref:Survival of motor neuron-related-splicing factor 30 n=1 Tax=Priapulus caudatus TaxID=37621 RepID=A0ABM1EYU4_PRICU|nr:PREDICTED: tudor domain-containing protein 3-like isoform X1 [Priapulus caudatus]XP_014677365.1 PREDICTED: tudor domain-containing protein 3-like isoform X2 [Priapulus caudatus]
MSDSRIEQLARQGWHLTPEGMQLCEAEAGSNTSNSNIIAVALNTDLKSIGRNWLPEEINRGKLDQLAKMGVVQIQKIRNVSAPKANEDSNHAPRLLKLVLTDGHTTVHALELLHVSQLSTATPPGTKLCLLGDPIPIAHGHLLLGGATVRVLGGTVEALVESWRFAREVPRFARVQAGRADGAPPFVPFGKRIMTGGVDETKRKTLEQKSREKGKDGKEEDADFQQQRQATIAEVARAKNEVKSKKFAGTGVQDKTALMGRSVGGAPTREFGARASHDAPERGEGGGDRGGGRGGRRRRHGQDDDDDAEADPSASRPSGPTTLFDFLEQKIPSKAETKGSSAPSQSHDGLSLKPGAGYSGSRSSNPRNDDFSKRYPQRLNENKQERSASYGNRQLQGGTSSRRQDNQRSAYDDGTSHHGSYRKESSNYSHDQRTQNDQKTRNPPYSNNRDGASSRWGNSAKSENRVEKNGPPQSSSFSSSATNSFSRRDNSGRSVPKPVDYKNQADASWNPDYGQSGRQRHYEGKADPYRHSNVQDGSRGEQQKQHRDDANKQQRDPDSKRSQDAISQNNRGDYMNTEGNSQRRPPNDTLSNQFSSLSITKPAGRGRRQQADVEGRSPWQQSDHCMARYWEDGRYYEAVIHAVSGNGSTAVVKFSDYGNYEEVFLTDLLPSGGAPVGAPSTAVPSLVFVSAEMPSVPPFPIDLAELDQQAYQQRRVPHRPSMPLYQPPSRRE